jgi:hypothetical protein
MILKFKFYKELKEIEKQFAKERLKNFRQFVEERRKIHNLNICKHCGGDIRIRNPKGFCDHLYYPENCKFCKREKK